MSETSQIKLSTFAEDVLHGLSATPKFLSSKYFYDDVGSNLFRQIMELPDYYLTNSETEIFQNHQNEIIDEFINLHKSFDLIELGAGDGTKTAILIDCLLKRGVDFNYSPIDISSEALDILTNKFKNIFPTLSIKPIHIDYLNELENLNDYSQNPKIILFLGSNIGNFKFAESHAFFQRINASISKNDLLLTGFDLQKDPKIILKAYDDSQGITALFNLNLLNRMNRELGANFDIEKFQHYAIYNPVEGAARSFLMSRVDQTVIIGSLNQEFHFKSWEPIYMEISQKYSEQMIQEIAKKTGFKIIKNFYDNKFYFTDSLWIKS